MHSTDLLSDLHVYDPVTATWTELSGTVSGDAPSPRAAQGTVFSGGKLYVHGGLNSGELPRAYSQTVMSFVQFPFVPPYILLCSQHCDSTLAMANICGHLFFFAC